MLFRNVKKETSDKAANAVHCAHSGIAMPSKPAKPTSAAEIPKAHKGEAWARLGVNVDDDFKPLYVVQSAKKAKLKELKAALKGADELLLATDEDREGEAISHHLVEILKPKVPVKRMVFHEITKAAVQEAIDNPRGLSEDLVGAQQARRALDYLVGFNLSPLLWKKVQRGLSAGRVQSPALRMIVDSELEIEAFKAKGAIP